MSNRRDVAGAERGYIIRTRWRRGTEVIVSSWFQGSFALMTYKPPEHIVDYSKHLTSAAPITLPLL